MKILKSSGSNIGPCGSPTDYLFTKKVIYFAKVEAYLLGNFS